MATSPQLLQLFLLGPLLLLNSIHYITAAIDFAHRYAITFTIIYSEVRVVRRTALTHFCNAV